VVITAVAIKSFTFWDIMPCSLLEVNRHFGGTYCLHHQRQSVNQARNQNEAGSTGSISCLLYAGFLIGLLSDGARDSVVV
jgi:hypothetical protein